MASGGAPYIAAVFDTQARLPEGASFAQTVDIALLAGKFNERAGSGLSSFCATI